MVNNIDPRTEYKPLVEFVVSHEPESETKVQNIDMPPFATLDGKALQRLKLDALMKEQLLLGDCTNAPLHELYKQASVKVEDARKRSTDKLKELQTQVSVGAGGSVFYFLTAD